MVRVRSLAPGDINFIYTTFLKGLYFGNTYYNLTPKKKFFEIYSKVVENLFQREETEVFVVCLEEDLSIILGYSIVEGEILHWVYIKPAWRGVGLLRKLFPKKITTFTHITDKVIKIMPQIRKRNISFSPFEI